LDFLFIPGIGCSILKLCWLTLGVFVKLHVVYINVILEASLLRTCPAKGIVSGKIKPGCNVPGFARKSQNPFDEAQKHRVLLINFIMKSGIKSNFFCPVIKESLATKHSVLQTTNRLLVVNSIPGKLYIGTII
jgi:hypothetical protein